ncbi:ABC transporter permease [Sandaracinobacter sp. RS1-74]|uniref:ABC transporter permease n=1 Tax=Sandaracinobacteroides sayramensis TaxID=2913411 RepID=UPI001EDA9046|nr:ABC transporter permease [Sandaracinobacteroides sayramensis]
MTIARFLATRLLAGAVVLWAAATLTFLMMHLAGGDTAIAILGGPDAMPSEAQIAKVRAEYGLDRPLVAQYGDFLLRLTQGNLGQSYRLRIPVADAIGRQLVPTIALALSAAAVSVVLAIVVAVATARPLPGRRGEARRAIASTSELILIAMPVFVIGLVLLLAFSVWLPLFPIVNGPGWRGLVLPALTMALPLAAVMSQILREGLEDVLEQPFILTARSRGLSDAGVRLRHALRHAATPVLTLAGFFLALLIGGAVITESLFARPGIGRLMVDAANAGDLPVVVGVTLLTALAYVVASILVDLIGALIDPRTVSA